VRVAEHGIQPRVVVDDKGTVHLSTTKVIRQPATSPTPAPSTVFTSIRPWWPTASAAARLP
jgi:hypothetical protein